MQRWIGAAAAVGAAVAALLLPSRASLAWGPAGHRVIADIAAHVLQQGQPGTLGKLRALLATDKDNHLTKADLAGEATWPDVLREKSPEARTATTEWHFTRLKADNPDLAAACYGHKPLPAGYPASHGPWNNCSIDKIAQFAKELQDPATSPGERLNALRFLLNLVADVNDPLATIDHGDRSGECTAVQVGGKPPVRLATYWESVLLHEVVGSDPTRGTARIIAGLPAAQAQQWAAGTPESWAQESYQMAKTVVYGFAEQPTGQARLPMRKREKETCATVPLYRVATDYETKALAAIKIQLAKAGIRLARVLADSLK